MQAGRGGKGEKKTTDSAFLIRWLQSKTNFDWFLIKYWNCDTSSRAVTLLQMHNLIWLLTRRYLIFSFPLFVYIFKFLFFFNHTQDATSGRGWREKNTKRILIEYWNCDTFTDEHPGVFACPPMHQLAGAGDILPWNKERTVRDEARDEEFHCLLQQAEQHLNISYLSQSYEMTPKCENMMFDSLAWERQVLATVKKEVKVKFALWI